jgi:hypothetical protein
VSSWSGTPPCTPWTTRPPRRPGDGLRQLAAGVLHHPGLHDSPEGTSGTRARPHV